MARAIIFDFGNVLGMFDKQTACEKLASYSKIKNAREIYNFLVGGQLEGSLESGKIGGPAFARAVIEWIAAKGLTTEKCMEIWGDIFRPNPGMADFLQELRARKIPIAVLSTTNAIHWPYIERLDTIRLLQSWNAPFILSHLEGAVKPEPRLYAAALSALGTAASETVFVDDSPESYLRDSLNDILTDVSPS
jgi:putative hydrolase of the HAD superfamily